MTVVDSDGLRSRFFLVVAAVSVITLAASSPIYSAVRGPHFTGQASASPVAAIDGTAPAAELAGPAGSAVLLSVSCSSPEMCIAVGTGVSHQTLAEKWDGKTWKVTSTAQPRGATGSNFYAVSCSSAHACMAVGGYETAALPRRSLPLAEAWDGQTWRVKVTPRPSSYSALDAVSCTSANRCMAVGSSIPGSANNAFSEVWNGRSWTIKRTPRPPGTTYSNLDGVSCASARVCVAVGDYQIHDSGSRTLAEAWNGKQWVRRAAPNPVSGANGSDLNAVSCRAANACVAVGVYANATNSGGLTLAETWNGKTWAMSPSGNKPSSAGSALGGVSCVSANACVAVGSETTSSIGSTLAERWTGGLWTIETTPNPNGATDSFLDSVSCASPSACVAVGEYFTNSGQGGLPLPVTEVWNGATWTIATVSF